MEDFGWTAGVDEEIVHQARIDSGAFGEVHKVHTILTCSKQSDDECHFWRGMLDERSVSIVRDANDTVVIREKTHSTIRNDH